MRVSLAVKERGAPAPLVREMSVLSGEDNEDNMDHAKLSTVHYIMYCTAGVVVLASTALLLCLVLLLLALRLARRRRRQRAQSAADLPLIYRWHQQQ